MTISAISPSFSFKSYKGALTNNGNEYKKTNTGKVIGTIAVPVLVTTASGIINKGFGGFQGMSATGVASVIALYATAGLVLGAIVDGCVNTVRRNNADKTVKAAK